MQPQGRFVRVVPSALVAAILLLVAACGSGSDNARSGPTTTAPAPTTAPVTDVPGSTPAGDLAVMGPLHTVPVGAITMAYRQFGAGPPVLLLVGQDSPLGYWGPDLPRRLARHHQVTMVDHRGVGASTDQPGVPLTIELMGDDTAGLIRSLGLDHPTVVGWSTGGEIALALAVRHPAVAGPLVLSGATAGGPTAVPASPEIEAMFNSTDVAEQANVLDHLFTPSGTAARDAYIDGILRMPGEDVSAATEQRQADAEAAFVRSTVTSDGLHRIRDRVVVINGAQDELVPPRNAEIIAGRIPHAELRIVPDAGHALMFQYPDWFVATVEAASARRPAPPVP